MEKYFLGENKERDYTKEELFQMKKISDYELEYLTDREKERERKYTTEELIQIVSDKDRILTLVEVSKIIDTIWPVDYKDTFIVPEGEALCFRGGNLVNGKYDVPGLKALGEKEKAGKLLLRRSLINRILAGETDCLKEPLTPENIAEVEAEYKKERDLIQEGILRAVGPLLDPDGTIIPPSQETAGNEEFEKNNGGISLPPEIDTPEARKAFENALKAGYLEKTSTGYKWEVLPKAAAAYLCKCIYKHPDWGKLDQLLGHSRLDQAIYQYEQYHKKEPNWIGVIDKLLKD